MKLSALKDQDIFVAEEKIGKIEDIYVNQNWQVTHFEIRFTKEAAHEILGAKMPIRNMLTISAIKEGNACCTYKGLEIKIAKSQLHLYLRPPEDT